MRRMLKVSRPLLRVPSAGELGSADRRDRVQAAQRRRARREAAHAAGGAGRGRAGRHLRQSASLRAGQATERVERALRCLWQPTKRLQVSLCESVFKLACGSCRRCRGTSMGCVPACVDWHQSDENSNWRPAGRVCVCDAVANVIPSSAEIKPHQSFNQNVAFIPRPRRP